jgi:hypothetical protein
VVLSVLVLGGCTASIAKQDKWYTDMCPKGETTLLGHSYLFHEVEWVHVPCTGPEK